MAMFFANRGLFRLLNSASSGATDIRAAVFKSAPPSAATFADYNFLSEVTAAHTEAVAANYSRQDLAGVAVTEVDGSNKATITATAPNFGGANIATGETWQFIVYYIFNASDASAELICMDDPAADLLTNGGQVTLPALAIDVVSGAGNFVVANRGLYLLLNLAISASTDLRCTPFTGTKPSTATVQGWNTLADAIADATNAESTYASARFDLAGVTITEVDTGTTDNVTITATAPTWPNYPAGETLTFLVYYVEAGTDATRELIGADLTTASQVTNGGNISYSALALTVND